MCEVRHDYGAGFRFPLPCDAEMIGETARVQVGRGDDFGNPLGSDLSILTIEAGGVMNVDSRDQTVGAGYQKAARVFIGENTSGNGRLIVTGTGSSGPAAP